MAVKVVHDSHDLCQPSTYINSVSFTLTYPHLYHPLSGHSTYNACTILARTLSDNLSSVI